MKTHAQYAFLADAAEEMFVDDLLAPPLHSSIEADWELVGYLTARNALLGLQIIGAGHYEYYGFLAVSRKDPMQYVAVVRGTRLPIEWLENLHGALLPILGPRKGLVEHGFWSIYDSMRYNRTKILNLPAPGGIATTVPVGATVTVIGHSLGAALGTYLMVDLARVANGRFDVLGCLFASPRPGDGRFAQEADQIVGHGNYVIYNYMRDIVPHVPPGLAFGLGFQHLPGATWITAETAQATVTNDVGCNHEALSYAALLDAEAAPLAGSMCPECNINGRPT